MSKVITLGKGSKRRLNQIRWKRIDVFGLALLAAVALAIVFLGILWDLRQENPHQEPIKGHQIKGAEPSEH